MWGWLSCRLDTNGRVVNIDEPCSRVASQNIEMQSRVYLLPLRPFTQEGSTQRNGGSYKSSKVPPELPGSARYPRTLRYLIVRG